MTTAIVGAALWPLRQYQRPEKQRVDGFPLSYYPMFSAWRDQYGHVSYAVGVRKDGSRFNLSYNMLGTGGVNQVRKQLFRAVSRGRVESHAQLLASRVALHPDCTDVVRVEIVRGEFDFDVCLLGRKVQGTETVLAGSDVHRPEHDAVATATAAAVQGASS